MTKPNLLIVEDDDSIRTQLKYALRDDYALWFAADRAQALALVQEVRPAVVSLDLGLPPSPETADEGLKALDEILQLHRAKVIVVTGNADRENAYRAVQLGALDFHLKPIDLAEYKTVLRRAALMQQLETESDEHFLAAASAVQFEDIIGNMAKMREIFALVTRVAKTDATVLIQGESGTGKELLAHAIHSSSRRHSRPFVPINCGAIPETLLEAELFGHEKGAYTGAHVQRKGKIEAAEGGTLFLDEIGELNPALQVKLLRFLQEREIERIGGRERIPVNVRVIAASNKNLLDESQAGRFREDLYYRLSVVTVTVPPLRERGEDIILLANAFLARNCAERRRRVKFSEDAMRAMLAYRWPGNIRELQNKVQRAVIMADGRYIEAGHLELEAPASPGEHDSLRDARARAERQSLIEALATHRGNISKAARALGVSRPTFHALIDKHGMNAREFRS